MKFGKLWLLLPAVILTAFVGIFPIFALLNYVVQTPFEIENRFVGLENLAKLFKDYRFTDAVLRTIVFAALSLLIQIPLGLGLAYLFRGAGKLNAILSSVIILPTLFPPVTIGMMWLLLTRTNGPFGITFNFLLNSIFGEPYDLYKNAIHAFATIILMDMWHWTGLTFLVSLAALTSMDETYILSARSEGATRWQIFRYAEFPQLLYPLLFITLLRLIDSLKIFDEVFILTGGGPGLSTEFVTQYIRTIGIEQWIFGFSSAMSLVYLYIVLILSWLLIVGFTRGRGILE
jgi:glycerol transport system permease protein